jgi:hypothetical protein
MKVLVACEYSGVVRDAFRRAGHSAWSCDLFPTDEASHFAKYHFQKDVLSVIRTAGWMFDLLIAHPPCTYLCSSGLHWNKRTPGREQMTERSIRFVLALMAAPIERIAIENPIGRISTAVRKPEQIIQPWQFGEDASKATCLWLKNLPVLKPTKLVEPRIVNGKKRWSNQTDSGQNRLGPSPDRWRERSKTYLGIAEAMADQWGKE